MSMCSNPRRARTNEWGFRVRVLVCGVLILGNCALAQIYLPKQPPEPPDYGQVVLSSHAATGPGAVVFDHWLHRSMFTCRVCHVDIGFAMTAGETGISATSNRQGFHCGACHDGKKTFNGNPVFAACSDVAANKQCDRCHSVGKKGARKYKYKSFTAKFPQANYGIDWEAAEASGIIKPLDFVEGVSVKKAPMKVREDFSIKSGLSWVKPIRFSHEKHTIWNGCELCHPEIFATGKKADISYSMFSNIEGRHCGACHRKVAFPLNNCAMCHSGAPQWAP